MTYINRNGVARVEPVQIASADGAINLLSGIVYVTKGSAAALTLAAPPSSANGSRLTIVSTTAFAHTVTNTSPGFNGGGAGSDVGTYGAAAGNAMELVAYNGNWYTLNLKGVTLA